MASGSIFLSLIFSASSVAKISSNVPPESATYELIDRLEAFRCAQPTYRGLRPQSHFDLRNALGLFEKQKEACAAPEWLLAEREVLIRESLQNDVHGGIGLRHEDTIPLPGIDAAVTPNNPLRYGRPDFYGGNLWGELVVNAAAGETIGLAVSATPGFVVAADDYKRFDGKAYLHEWYLKVGYGRAEATLGRTALKVGGPRHGTLLLSDAAKPVNLWKVAVRPSLTLDGTGDFLGPFSFETWLADQGSGVGVPNSKLWAIGLGARPFDSFEISVLQLNQFGGTGAPPLQASDALQMLYYSGDVRLDSLRQRQMLIDVALWAPSGFAKLYSQFHFESLQDLDGPSALVGLWLPRLGDWDARVEYARTVPSAYTHPFWTQGMTYQGTPLGHPVGPGGQALYLDLGLPVVGLWRPSLGGFYEARGERRAGVAEYRYGATAELVRRWGRIELSSQARYAHIRNQLFVVDEQTDSVSLWATLKYSFL